MFKLITLFTVLFISTQTYAIRGGVSLGSGLIRLSPIVSYDQVQRNYPTPHTSNVLSYGLGIELGPRAFTIEIQGTQSEDTSTYSETNTTIKETIQKISLGIKSYFGLKSMLNFYLRGGAQGKKIKNEITQNGTTASDESAMYVDPYVGAGLRIRMAKFFSLSLGITAVFTDYPNKGETEYQSTVGVGIGF